MLRLSIYLNLSFEHRNDLTKDQYSYGFDFFNQLVGIEVEKPYNNNLFNGIRDLTIEDKNYILNTPEGKKQCATFVLNWLIPSLQVLTIDDYYSKLKSVIENDETISLKTKEGLLKPLNDGKKEIYSFSYPGNANDLTGYAGACIAYNLIRGNIFSHPGVRLASDINLPDCIIKDLMKLGVILFKKEEK